jgi:RND family efflux transporter MFP subunit
MMNDNMRKTILIFIAAAVMTGCGGGQTEKDTPTNDSVQAAAVESAGVKVPSALPAPDSTVVQFGSVKTMGKVVAARYADLSFETALPIERILVKNGQHVRRGQVLAQLDAFKLHNAIEQQKRAIDQAKLQIEQAHLQMQDVIISQGYDPDKSSTVPQQVAHNADVKSGYALAKSQLATAQTQLAAAQHELRSGVLTAPFDGVVANLSVQAHQLAQAGQTVCRVIASGDMMVEFRVMESDLCRYQIGTKVNVIPVADPSQHYTATISEINPVVDEQGAITLRARLGATSNLFDGMNVEVILSVEN